MNISIFRIVQFYFRKADLFKSFWAKKLSKDKIQGLSLRRVGHLLTKNAGFRPVQPDYDRKEAAF